MAPSTHPKKRKFEPSAKARLPTKKKSRKQQIYDSGSSDESEDGEAFVARDAPRKKTNASAPVESASNGTKAQPVEKSILEGSDSSESGSEGGSNLGGEQEEEEITDAEDSGDDDEQNSESDVTDSDESQDADGMTATKRQKTKRHDPSAFANSLSTILSSKLPSSKRVDPVLSRSKDAQTAGHELAEGKLEAKARRKLRDEKRLATEKGRVKDILLGDRHDAALLGMGDVGGMSAADIAEQERRLRKTAQRGVVKLFNAVRAAQVKGEEAQRLVREQGLVGEKKREQKVGEMGRNAFLEMVGSGVKGS